MVVGSIDIDLRLEVAAIPRSAETILARRTQRSAGAVTTTRHEARDSPPRRDDIPETAGTR
ncbi:hypothetical protein [Georgenia ruanii]|uniref:hypothetical protein n=1 Tax=Georgenia ruanii TaxID=348442 RepID=UPI00126551F7|nr:hypothetical protein [Georgenia ruanii]